MRPEALRRVADSVRKDEPEEPETEDQPKGATKAEAAITVEIKTGQVLTDKRGERYVIKKKLGEGGMGGVFEIEEARTGIVRAVKFMNSRNRKISSYVKRFEREIKVLAHLNNPFILTAQKVVEFEIDGEVVTGFVTSFVEGPNLDEEIQKEKQMPFERLVLLAGQMALALEALREQGIVHRDLKPQNIFLQQMPKNEGQKQAEQFVRIGDFGIVGFAFESEKPTQDDDPFFTVRNEKLTRSGYTVGTPMYMSPEAASGKELDHRSDLYSLGIVMYNMVTGHPPFTGEPLDVLKAQISRIPFPMAREDEQIPDWLQDIVMTLLQKDPEDRFQSARDVFLELKAGVAKDYPELLNEIPFIWNIKPTSYDASLRSAA